MKKKFENIDDIKIELYKYLMLEDMDWENQYTNRRNGEITHIYKGMVELYNCLKINDINTLYNLYIDEKTLKKSLKEYKYKSDNNWENFPNALDELSKIQTLESLEEWIGKITKYDFFNDSKLTFENLNENKIACINKYGNNSYKIRDNCLTKTINQFFGDIYYNREMSALKEIKNVIINQSNLDIVEKTKQLESKIFDFSKTSNIENKDIDYGLQEITNIIKSGNQNDLISLLTNMYKEIVHLKTKNNDINLTEKISWNENYSEIYK